MSQRRAILTVITGPNEGDTLSVDIGTCRLIGRHLSETETAMIDRDGKRILDGASSDILKKHLKDKAPATGSTPAPEVSISSFERGPDIVFADDAISRAHAMVFFDQQGLGIIDLASTNGTYVDQERVTTASVRDGDTVTIGSSDLTVKMR